MLLELFLADDCFWFYLCMYLYYWLVFLPLLVTYMRHAFYLKSYCSVSLLSEISVGVMLSDLLWAVSPIGSSRQYC